MSTARIPGLDGVRGLAAIGVLVHHVVLVWSPETRQAYAATSAVSAGPVGWALTYTPLHVVWVGTADVLVFFALSGLVLAAPFLRPDPAARPHVLRFWSGRVARLYLPAWASLAFALVLLGVLTAHEGRPVESLPILRAAEDALLVPLHVSNQVNGVLWSLSWEVAFTAAIPLLAMGFRAVERLGHRRPSAARVVLAAVPLSFLVAALPASHLAGQAMIQAAAFLGGVAIAGARRIGAVRPRETTTRSTWAALVALAVALTARWCILPFDPGALGLRTADAVVAAGAIGVVWWVATSSAAQRALVRPVPLLIGALSFSTYLVHAPVLEGVHALLGGDAWTIVVALPLVVAASLAFHHVVERPSHRLARSLARRPRAPDRR